MKKYVVLVIVVFLLISSKFVNSSSLRPFKTFDKLNTVCVFGDNLLYSVNDNVHVLNLVNGNERTYSIDDVIVSSTLVGKDKCVVSGLKKSYLFDDNGYYELEGSYYLTDGRGKYVITSFGSKFIVYSVNLNSVRKIRTYSDVSDVGVDYFGKHIIVIKNGNIYLDNPITGEEELYYVPSKDFEVSVLENPKLTYGVYLDSYMYGRGEYISVIGYDNFGNPTILFIKNSKLVNSDVFGDVVGRPIVSPTTGEIAIKTQSKSGYVYWEILMSNYGTQYIFSPSSEHVSVSPSGLFLINKGYGYWYISNEGWNIKSENEIVYFGVSKSGIYVMVTRSPNGKYIISTNTNVHTQSNKENKCSKGINVSSYIDESTINVGESTSVHIILKNMDDCDKDTLVLVQIPSSILISEYDYYSNKYNSYVIGEYNINSYETREVVFNVTPTEIGKFKILVKVISDEEQINVPPVILSVIRKSGDEDNSSGNINQGSSSVSKQTLNVAIKTQIIKDILYVGDEIPIQVSVTNNEDYIIPVRVLMKVPNNILITGSYMTDTTGSLVVSSFDLQPGETRSISITVSASESGSYTIPVIVKVNNSDFVSNVMFFVHEKENSTGTLRETTNRSNEDNKEKICGPSFMLLLVLFPIIRKKKLF